MERNNASMIRQNEFSIDPRMQIVHVSLNVSDIQRSLEFYQSVLGFRLLGKASNDRALLTSEGNSSHLVELLQVKESEISPQITKRAGLYHFAILLPERKYLADMLLNLRDKRDQVHFDGLADHLVSESIYIRDPDFNGIEIYQDRPVTEWNWKGNQIEMATLPLDSKSLLNESTKEGWTQMPAKTSIGHVHLHVKDLAKAMKFYHLILGLNLTTTFPSAAFFAAGKYHHHIAANTWLGNDISPASQLSVGLNHFSIRLSSKGQFENTLKHLSEYNRESESSDGTTSIYLRDNDEITLRLSYM